MFTRISRMDAIFLITDEHGCGRIFWPVSVTIRAHPWLFHFGCGSAALCRSVVRKPVWCLRNNYTFVALKLAWGEARMRECIPSDTRPTEQRSPRPISAQPGGRHVFWAEALLLAPHRSTLGYARRSRLASGQNPLPRMYSYFGDTTLEEAVDGDAQHTERSLVFQTFG